MTNYFFEAKQMAAAFDQDFRFILREMKKMAVSDSHKKLIDHLDEDHRSFTQIVESKILPVTMRTMNQEQFAEFYLTLYQRYARLRLEFLPQFTNAVRDDEWAKINNYSWALVRNTFFERSPLDPKYFTATPSALGISPSTMSQDGQSVINPDSALVAALFFIINEGNKNISTRAWNQNKVAPDINDRLSWDSKLSVQEKNNRYATLIQKLQENYNSINKFNPQKSNHLENLAKTLGDQAVVLDKPTEIAVAEIESRIIVMPIPSLTIYPPFDVVTPSEKRSSAIIRADLGEDFFSVQIADLPESRAISITFSKLTSGRSPLLVVPGHHLQSVEYITNDLHLDKAEIKTYFYTPTAKKASDFISFNSLEVDGKNDVVSPLWQQDKGITLRTPNGVMIDTKRLCLPLLIYKKQEAGMDASLTPNQLICLINKPMFEQICVGQKK